MRDGMHDLQSRDDVCVRLEIVAGSMAREALGTDAVQTRQSVAYHGNRSLPRMASITMGIDPGHREWWKYGLGHLADLEANGHRRVGRLALELAPRLDLERVG